MPTCQRAQQLIIPAVQARRAMNFCALAVLLLAADTNGTEAATDPCAPILGTFAAAFGRKEIVTKCDASNLGMNTSHCAVHLKPWRTGITCAAFCARYGMGCADGFKTDDNDVCVLGDKDPYVGCHVSLHPRNDGKAKALICECSQARCSDGTFWDAAAAACLPNHIANCKVQSSNQVCAQCDNGYFSRNDGGACSAATLISCAEEMDFGCALCQAGYSVTFSGAAPSCTRNTIPDCEQQQHGSGPALCDQCAAGFYRSSNQSACLKNTITGCAKQEDKDWCERCEIGLHRVQTSAAASRCATATAPYANCHYWGEEDHYSTDETTSCEICQIGYYHDENSRTCVKIDIPHCKEQKDSEECDGDQCTAGYFWEEDLRSCVQIAVPNCNEGEDTSTCHECQSGYYTIDGGKTCRAVNVTGCHKQGTATTCLECHYGRYWNGTSCQRTTIAGCRDQRHAALCAACHSGYYAVDNGAKCAKNSIVGCASQASATLCSHCRSGFHASQGGTACALNSLVGCADEISANNVSMCLRCDRGYFLNLNQTCSKVTVAGCRLQTVSGLCDACIRGYFLSDATGTACVANDIEGCVTQRSKNQCSSCVSGRYRSSDGAKCATITIEGCVSQHSENQCSECIRGRYYSADRGKCVPITIDGCTRQRNAYECLSCQHGSFIDSERTRCGTNSIVGCAQQKSATECDTCQNGYYKNATEKCVKNTIADCSRQRSATDCETCRSGYYKQNATCVKANMPGCRHQLGPATCGYCDWDGYFKNANGTCSKRMSGCSHQESDTKCGNCNSGYYLNVNSTCSAFVNRIPFCSYQQSETKCGSCDAGYYVNANSTCSTRTITNHIPFCSNQQSDTTCITCFYGYRRNANGTCSKRMPGCSWQESDTKCDHCNSGYFKNADGSCSKMSIPFCKQQSSAVECVSCDEGYYKANASCSKNTIPGCVEQQDAVTCKRCGGYYLYGNQYAQLMLGPNASSCVESTIAHCEEQTDIMRCPSCKLGYARIPGSHGVADECVESPIEGCMRPQVSREVINVDAGSYESSLETSLGSYESSYSGSPYGSASHTTTPIVWACGFCSTIGRYFKINADKSLCVGCKVGQYTDAVAPADGTPSCKDCPSGQFSNQSGSTFCHQHPCASGRYGLVGRSSIEAAVCEDCAAGQYQTQQGQGHCKSCTPGEFQDITGQAWCKACPAGKSTNGLAGQTNVLACTDKYASHQVSFRASLGGFETVAEFDAVARGAYREGLARTITGVSAADVSLSNVTLSGQAQPSRRLTPGIAFLAGVRADSIVSALSIRSELAGLKSAHSNTSSPLHSNVRDAFVERSVSFDRAAFDKTPVVVGDEVVETAPLPEICTIASATQACPRGRFHNATQAGACSDCLPGQHSAVAGAGSCKGNPCAAGKYAAAAATDPANCIACKPGRYVGEPAQTSCKGSLCVMGKYHEAGQTTPHTCKKCAGGQYTDVEGEAACKGTACVPGKFRFDTEQSGECHPCQPGTYADTAGHTECKGTMCAAPTCAITAGATSQASASCIQCPSGKVTNAPGQLCGACDQQPAAPCQAGYASDTGTEPCELICGAGTFSAKGWAPCQPCAAGQFSDVDRAIQCKQCPGGQYQANTGMTSCVACDGDICFHGRTGPATTQDSTAEFVRVLAQSDTLNLFGWDRVTNYKGADAGEPLYYELFGAVEVNETLYTSRDFNDQVLARQTWEMIDFGPNSAFKPTDNLRLAQADAAGFRGSVVEKYFVKGDNTLFFFKVGAKTEPGPLARTQNSSVLPGVIENPEPPSFIVSAQGGLLDVQGAVPDPKPGALVRFTATFRGKPLPNKDQVTWFRNNEPLPAWPSQACEDEDGTAFTCPLITHECQRNLTVPQCTITLTIPAMERAHPGKYKAELVSFATTAPVASPEVDLGLECFECSICDPGAVEDKKRGECVCNPGRYRADGDTLLGFVCTECHSGWNCSDKLPTQGVDVLATVPVKPGFYRYNATDKISIRCMDHAPKTAAACKGGVLSEQCAVYHTGVFCHTCEDGYATSRTGVCEPCPKSSIDINLVATAVGAVVYLLVVYVLHRYMISRKVNLIKAYGQGEKANKAHKAAGEAMAKAKAKAMAMAAKASDPTSFKSQQIKIVISWVQIVSAFSFTFSIPWPEGFETLLKNLMPWVNLDIIGIFVDFATIKCNLNTSFKNGFVAHMCLLPALVLACLLAALLSRCASKVPAQRIKERAIKIVGFVIFVLYPGLCSKIFSVWDCVPVDDKGTEFLASDLRVQCHVGGDGHTTLVGFAFTFMLVYALGIPLAALVILWTKRHEIYDRDVTLGLEIGQLYEGYQRTVWFWEVVVMVRKLILTGALILLSRTATLQITVGCVVCAIYTTTFLWVQPLGLVIDHILEVLTSLQLMVTLIMGLYLKAKEAQDALGKAPTRMQDELSDMVLLFMFGFTAVLGAATACLGLLRKKLQKSGKAQWLFSTLPDLQRKKADLLLSPLLRVAAAQSNLKTLGEKHEPPVAAGDVERQLEALAGLGNGTGTGRRELTLDLRPNGKGAAAPHPEAVLV